MKVCDMVKFKSVFRSITPTFVLLNGVTVTVNYYLQDK